MVLKQEEGMRSQAVLEIEVPEKGTPIGVREAARKYGYAPNTISLWATNYKWVDVIEKEDYFRSDPETGERAPAQRVVKVDEHDICVVILKRAPRRGRPSNAEMAELPLAV